MALMPTALIMDSASSNVMQSTPFSNLLSLSVDILVVLLKSDWVILDCLRALIIKSRIILACLSEYPDVESGIFPDYYVAKIIITTTFGSSNTITIFALRTG